MRFRVLFHGPRLALALAVFSAAKEAGASEPTASELTIARQRFTRALTFQEQKDWDGASALLEAVLKIKQTPGVYYHLGHCREQQGQLVEALLQFDRARELLDSGSVAPDVAQLLHQKLGALRQRIPKLTIRMDSDIRDVHVELNGRELNPSVATEPIPVNPGHHTIQVSAPGFEPVFKEVKAVEGAATELPIRLLPVPSEKIHRRPRRSQPKKPPEASVDPTAALLGWTFAGTGAAGAVGSVYLFLAAGSQGQNAQEYAIACQNGVAGGCNAHDAAATSRDAHFWWGMGLAGAAAGLGVLAGFQFWPEPTRDQAGWSVQAATRF